MAASCSPEESPQGRGQRPRGWPRADGEAAWHTCPHGAARGLSEATPAAPGRGSRAGNPAGAQKEEPASILRTRLLCPRKDSATRSGPLGW